MAIRTTADRICHTARSSKIAKLRLEHAGRMTILLA
jgi:hypothetical protein